MTVENGRLNFEEIKQYLPHRYPFLLVDRVLKRDANSITALKNLTANEEFFGGHFPHKAVMPGVLQIESMAQTIGLLLSTENNFNPARGMAFLAGVNDAKFKKIVGPGDQLIISASIINQKKGVIKANAKITVDEELVSSATIILVVKSEK